MKNWERLLEDTQMFRHTLMESTLPAPVLDAIQGNLAILKSSTCMRLEDGSFYGWEGVSQYNGSCEGTCQHVWNYTYALPFLFPNLERQLCTNELTYNIQTLLHRHEVLSIR